MLDSIVFWLTLFSAAGLAYLIHISAAVGVLLAGWSLVLCYRSPTRGYGLRILKTGALTMLVGATIFVLLYYLLPSVDGVLLVWPVGPAFFGWGGVVPTIVHFRYRDRPLEEPV
jgi:hypothetical protein